MILPNLNKYKHIEYSFIDGVCFRVCRPFTNDQIFLVPIITPEDEYEKDKARIIIPMFPTVNDPSGDPNELRDHIENPAFDYSLVTPLAE